MQGAQVELSSQSQLHLQLWKSALISFLFHLILFYSFQLANLLQDALLTLAFPSRHVEGQGAPRAEPTFDYSGHDRKRIHTILHIAVFFSAFDATAPCVETFHVTKLRMVNVFSYKDQFSKRLQKRLTQHVFVCHYTHLLLILHSAVHCIDGESFFKRRDDESLTQPHTCISALWMLEVTAANLLSKIRADGRVRTFKKGNIWGENLTSGAVFRDRSEIVPSCQFDNFSDFKMN